MQSPKQKRRVFLGLGSNLGDKEKYLTDALKKIPDLTKVSGLYETDPIGYKDQDSFLNLAAELYTDLGGRQLLDLAQRLEKDAERVRTIRFGPRTLDVDILWIDGETIEEEDLQVPHPRMRERAFVMVSLSELAPELTEGWKDPEEGGFRRIDGWQFNG